MPESPQESVRRAADYIGSRAPGFRPRAAIILGSGLSEAAPELAESIAIPYRDIPGFPGTSVPGHEGTLVLGRLGSLPAAVFKGRFHYYEGHSMETVALPPRVVAALGAETLVITAAVGSMRPRMRPGDLVVLEDHINFMGVNPLRGAAGAAFGPLFTDLTAAYDAGLSQAATALAKKKRLRCHRGVYLALSGPSYETPAEIKAYQKFGGDVVGMSVVPETIAARQAGLRVAAVTWVSNMGAGLSRTPPRHEEVLDIGRRISASLKSLLTDFLPLCASST